MRNAMPKPNEKHTNSVRIIGGKCRGRKVQFPDLPGLRPTPDRVRETLFNWLMHDVQDSKILDLFAGSGALGLEALSRGAKTVVFVEREKDAALSIGKHLEQFGMPSSSYELHHRDALDYLSHRRSAGESFDLIFLDPPFGQGLLAKFLPLCLAHLSATGQIYLEQEASLDKASYLPAGVTVLKEKTAGDVTYLLLCKSS